MDVKTQPTTASTTAIEAHDVSVSFHRDGKRVQALQGVDISIARGQFVCLVGPSGCGKSTLLNLTAGLVAPSAGTVRFMGGQVPRPNTRVGYITQQDNLFPWRTVYKNVAYPLEVRGVARSTRRQRVDEMIRLVGLDGFRDAYPAELSGGMRKRVSLARTLVYGPETLLADEPFGALDAQLKLVLAAEFLRIWHETRSTVVFVTHDLMEAISLGDRVIVFSGRPGRILEDCEIDIPRPRDPFTVRSSPRAVELHDRLWESLVGQIKLGENL